jgi:hypothetical protein
MLVEIGRTSPATTEIDGVTVVPILSGKPNLAAADTAGVIVSASATP